MEDQALREKLCLSAYQLWLRGMMPGEAGLLSVESTRRRFLVTPLGFRRAELRAGDLATVDLGGMAVDGGHGLEPGVWLPHRMAYQAEARPGETGRVAATALVSPPHLTALIRLQRAVDAINLAHLPPLPLARVQEESVIRRSLAKHGAVLLVDLGLLAAGPTLGAVLNVIEQLEQAAMVEVLCRAAAVRSPGPPGPPVPVGPPGS